MNWTPEQYRAYQAQANTAKQRKNPGRGGSKYKSTKVESCGIKFDSKKEYMRWCDLLQMQLDGLIADLKTQVGFVLADSVKFAAEPRAKPALKYIADFTYVKNGVFVVEDVKSKMTRSLPAYRIKKHLMMTIHGIEISEV